VLEDGCDIAHRLDEVVVGKQCHRLRLRDGFERHLCLRDDCEGALAASQERGHIEDAVLADRLDDPVEVVSGDVPLEGGVPGLDLVGLLVEDAVQFRVDAGLQVPVGVATLCEFPARDFAEGRHGAVREDDITLLDVGVGLAVLQGVGTGRVVPDGTPEDGLVPPGGVGRELQAVVGERGVQVAQADAGLRTRSTLLGARLDDAVHVAREIEHDCLVDRLPGETRAAPAWQHRNPVVGAVLHHARHVGRRVREDDADRRHFVDAGVGRVELAGVLVEANLPLDPCVERANEIGLRNLLTPVVVVRCSVGRRVEGGFVVRSHAWVRGSRFPPHELKPFPSFPVGGIPPSAPATTCGTDELTGQSARSRAPRPESSQCPRHR